LKAAYHLWPWAMYSSGAGRVESSVPRIHMQDSRSYTSTTSQRRGGEVGREGGEYEYIHSTSEHIFQI
jgi:hypothetical protein